jgi:hypothetical protein
MKRPAAVLVSLSLVVLPDWVAGAVASQVSFPAIDGNAVLQHIKVLSSDRFEGRAPGTNGEELTVPYWEDQFKKLGLKPGNTDGTYIQKVPMVGITPDPTMTLTFKKRSAEDQLRYLDDFVAWTRHVAPTAAL